MCRKICSGTSEHLSSEVDRLPADACRRQESCGQVPQRGSYPRTMPEARSHGADHGDPLDPGIRKARPWRPAESPTFSLLPLSRKVPEIAEASRIHSRSFSRKHQPQAGDSPGSSPTTTVAPSGARARLQERAHQGEECQAFPRFRSQTLTVRSSEAERARRPSALTATEFTPEAWPARVRTPVRWSGPRP